MAEPQTMILDRLHKNLKVAGITVDEATIQGVIDKGFLAIPTQFEEMARGFPTDLVPDYLGSWGSSLTPTASPERNVSEEESSSAPPDSIVAIAKQIKQRDVSPVELTQRALARIAERDSELNAFQLVLTERALAAAQQAEAEIKQGHYRGPLHGVPVAIKDLRDLDGTPTTAGSKILANQIAEENATVVDRLEAAGAIIVGKTRMSEFAYAPGSINAHYGPTRNPRNPAYDTGGSSSGSAAAVADGLVYTALGTDTGCSIRQPAAFCGLVGLKPTFGRVSLAGGVTLSWSLDHCGPLARNVADAALLLAVLAGPDPRDIRTRTGSEFSFAQFTQAPTAIRGLRIGVLGNDGTNNPLATPEVLTAWRSGLARLEKQGATLVEIDLPDMNMMRMVGGAMIANEARAYHQPNLQTRFQDYGEFLQQRLLAAFAYDATAFIRAQQMRTVLRQRANQIFEQIDLLSTPSIPTVAPTLGTIGSTALLLPFNLLGWPAITVPVGQTEVGLPMGLQLVGKPWDELTVLRGARALEVG